MARVKVFNSFGELNSVPEEQLQDAIRQGYRVATPEQLEQRSLEKEYGVASGVALGAVRGIPVLGPLALAGAEKLSPDFGETVRDIQRARPGAVQAAEIGTSLGVALATLGVGAELQAASRGAQAAAGAAEAATAAELAAAAEAAATGSRLGVIGRAVSAVPRAAVAAGNATAEALGATGGAARLISGAAAAGFENALQGGALEVERMTLEGKELLAGENLARLATTTAINGGVGAGLGLGFGLLGESLRVGANKTRSLYSEASNGETISQKMVGIGAKLRGAKPEQVEALKRAARTSASADEFVRANDEYTEILLGKPASSSFERGATREAQAVATDNLLDAARVESEAVGDFAKNIDEVLAKNAKDIAEDRLLNKSQVQLMNDSHEASEVLAQFQKEAPMREELFARLVDREKVEAQRELTLELIGKARRTVDSIEAANKAARAEGGQEFAVAKFASYKKALKNAEDRAYKAIGEPDESIKLARALDVDLKRETQRLVKFYKSKSSDPLAAATLDEFSKLEEEIRPALELADVWGNKFATYQRRRNAALHTELGNREAYVKDNFDPTPRRKNPVDPYKEFQVVDPKKVDRITQDFAANDKSPQGNSFRNYITSHIQSLKVAEQSGEFPPEQLRLIQVEIKRSETILKNFERMVERAKDKDLYRISAGLGGVSEVAQYLPENLRGIALKLTDPTRILRAQAAARTVKNGAQDAVEAGSKRGLAAIEADAIDVGVEPVRATAAVQEEGASKINASLAEAAGVVGSEAPKVPGRARKVASAVSSGARSLYGRLPMAGASWQRYDERSRRVKELSAQLPAVTSELDKQLAWVGDAAPTVKQAAVATAARQLEYLNANMPKGLKPATPFARELPPSRQQMKEWLNRLDAIEKPTSLLDNIANGKLTPEAVDAVRSVYPETFAAIQQNVLDGLTEMESKGKLPKYSKRIELGILLGIPTDPTMTPEVMQAVQAQYGSTPTDERMGQVQPMGAGKPQKAPDFAAAYRSGAEDTELTSEAV